MQGVCTSPAPSVAEYFSPAGKAGSGARTLRTDFDATRIGRPAARSRIRTALWSKAATLMTAHSATASPEAKSRVTRSLKWGAGAVEAVGMDTS